jgi:signal transduction histidine kinase
MLVEFIVKHREALIALTRAKVAVRLAPRPTESELASGVPLFLDRLAETLRLRPDARVTGMEQGAAAHGAALLGRGYTVAQVVQDYGEICQAITELAESLGSTIAIDEFQTLNRCLDDAIAEAVTEYVRLRDEAMAGETERSAIFAQELRSRISAAQLSFMMIRSGRAPAVGSVATVVAQNFHAMSALANRALVEGRLASGQVRRRIHVHDLIADAEVDGATEASLHGVSLAVVPASGDIDIDADPQILAGCLAGLLQNAFKATRAGGTVSVAASAADGRVEIGVQDQCGGLPHGKAEQLSAAMGQRGANPGGLGRGLFVTRKGIEASGGQVHVRDLPGKGCVFTIDLPRMARV